MNRSMMTFTIPLNLSSGRHAAMTLPVPFTAGDMRAVEGWLAYMKEVVEDKESPDLFKVKTGDVWAWTVVDNEGTATKDVFDLREFAEANVAACDKSYPESTPHRVFAIIPADMVEDDNDR